MFRSLELIGLVTNIDKLILFDLVNVAPKQPGPTDSWKQVTYRLPRHYVSCNDEDTIMTYCEPPPTAL
jgi:hypothetical protein